MRLDRFFLLSGLRPEPQLGRGRGWLLRVSQCSLRSVRGTVFCSAAPVRFRARRQDSAARKLGGRGVAHQSFTFLAVARRFFQSNVRSSTPLPPSQSHYPYPLPLVYMGVSPDVLLRIRPSSLSPLASSHQVALKFPSHTSLNLARVPLQRKSRKRLIDHI